MPFFFHLTLYPALLAHLDSFSYFSSFIHHIFPPFLSFLAFSIITSFLTFFLCPSLSFPTSSITCRHFSASSLTPKTYCSLCITSCCAVTVKQRNIERDGKGGQPVPQLIRLQLNYLLSGKLGTFPTRNFTW